MSTAVADPLLGRLLDDRYEIRRRLATGGMATVYAAIDTRLDRPVAVKVMHPALAADEEFVARFRREAKAAARLSSPTVVNVTDQGQDAGTVFLVMELVDGHTLRDVLRQEGALSPTEAVGLISPVLEALGAAHAAGYVHRDVKPENVLIGEDGRVKVGDFGLARAVDASPLTATTGLLLGTVAYLAPEQVRRGVADARTDVYAAGVLLFEMLTGRPPFEGDTALSVAYQHLHDRVPAPSTYNPDVSEELDELVLQATEPDPDHRPVDAAAMLDDLRHIAAGLPPARGVRLRRVVLPEEPARPRLGGARVAAPLGRRGGGAGVDDPDVDGPEGGDPGVGGPGLAASRDRADQADRGDGTARTTRFSRGADGKLRAISPAGTHDLASGDTDDLVGLDDESLDDPDGALDAERDPDADSGLDPDLDADAAHRRRWPLSVLRRPKPSTVGWLALLLVTLLAIGGVWELTVGRGVSIPQTAALDPTTAEARLRAVGFTVVRGADDYSETAPRGTVAETSPGGGSRAGKGTRIALRISLGPERYTLLPLRGRTYDTAVRTLATQKLKPGNVRHTFDDQVPAGQIIASDPVAGTVLRPGTPVDLRVSDGPAPVAAPNVIGQPADAAEQALTRLTLHVTRKGVFSDTVPLDQVMDLQPPTELHRGQPVTLVVSLGPELIEIPDVAGQSRSTALATLQARGFRVRVLNVPGFDSFVAREVPSAGNKARKGSLITLVLA